MVDKPRPPVTLAIADDDETSRWILSTFLESRGYLVRTAAGGQEAIELALDESVSLLLLDIRMPDISGIDVLRVVRQKRSARVLPVLMVTALVGSEQMVEAFDRGANDYITKPFDLPVVLARVAAHLRAAEPHGKGESDVAGEALDAPQPGAVVAGRFRIGSELGRGSVGIVYRAWDLVLKRPVAMKILRTGGLIPETLARFQREGLWAKLLKHPHAVEVLHSGVTSSGLAYLAMELLEGESLDKTLKREKRLRPARCAEILIPVCEVLEQAQARGLVHRDVKPGNIFLEQTPEGERIKVLDFGLTRRFHEVTSEERLTDEGTVLGTLEYMGPERFKGMDGGSATDVYSLGVTLYEMIAGRPPFEYTNGNPIELAMQHLEAIPRLPDDRAAEAGPELVALILEALAKQPGDRPTLGEFRQRLEAAATSAES